MNLGEYVECQIKDITQYADIIVPSSGGWKSWSHDWFHRIWVITNLQFNSLLYDVLRRDLFWGNKHEHW
jgi:hypothetical protein